MSEREGAPVAAGLDPYWVNRMDAIYIQYAYFMARVIGRDASSVLDVGSKKCGYLDWMDWIPKKVSIDLVNPYESEAVQGIKEDFFPLTFQMNSTFVSVCRFWSTWTMQGVSRSNYCQWRLI